jgi:hypothetical protein
MIISQNNLKTIGNNIALILKDFDLGYLHTYKEEFDNYVKIEARAAFKYRVYINSYYFPNDDEEEELTDGYCSYISGMIALPIKERIKNDYNDDYIDVLTKGDEIVDFSKI